MPRWDFNPTEMGDTLDPLTIRACPQYNANIELNEVNQPNRRLVNVIKSIRILDK